jgi:hypothetical protein
MTKKNEPVLIGDLLVKAEMVTMRDMADSIPISLKTGLPIGRVMVGSGALTDMALQQALLAQSLVRDQLLSMDMAISALRLVGTRKMLLDTALRELGWKSESFELTNRLGQLLLDAGVLTTDQLTDALEAFYSAGLPLARILVLKGIISNMLAYAALQAQVLIRDGKITREQALEAVRTASMRRGTIEESPDLHGYLRLQSTHTVRLGELLVMGSWVTEIELLSAVEKSLFNGMPVGEVLVANGQISQERLDNALELQQMVTGGGLDPLQAGQAMKRMKASGISLKQALQEVTEDSMPLEVAEPSRFEKWSAQQPGPAQGAAPGPAGGGSDTKVMPNRYEMRIGQMTMRLNARIAAFTKRNEEIEALIKKHVGQLSIPSSADQLPEIEAPKDPGGRISSLEQMEDQLSKLASVAYRHGYLSSQLAQHVSMGVMEPVHLEFESMSSSVTAEEARGWLQQGPAEQQISAHVSAEMAALFPPGVIQPDNKMTHTELVAFKDMPAPVPPFGTQRQVAADEYQQQQYMQQQQLAQQQYQQSMQFQQQFEQRQPAVDANSVHMGEDERFSRLLDEEAITKKSGDSDRIPEDARFAKLKELDDDEDDQPADRSKGSSGAQSGDSDDKKQSGLLSKFLKKKQP